MFSGTGNARIAVRLFAKRRAGKFSFWRVKNLLPAPKRKNSHAAFFGSAYTDFTAREEQGLRRQPHSVKQDISQDKKNNSYLSDWGSWGRPCLSLRGQKKATHTLPFGGTV